MQSRQGYCSYCCVRYTNLEQHMSSAQHRYLTTQNRQRMGTSSLMERFLQDVLRHHPYHYQESRSRQNERLLRNTAPSSEVVPTDDSVPEEMADDATGVRGEIATKSFEPLEELYSRPSKSQEYMQGVPVRPSVIQKLEKGQQQPLEFVYKIGSGLKEFNPVGIGQTTNNRQNLLYPSVISTAPASRLAECSYDRSVTTNSTRLPLAAHSDSVIKCDPNKVDRYLEQRDRGSRNPIFSSHLAASSVIYQKPKESNRKSVFIKSDKLSIQEDIKSRSKTLSTGFKPHECEGTAGSLKFESLSKSAVNPAVNLNKTDMPSNKRIFEDAIPKHHDKFFNMDHNQEVKHLVFKKSAFLGQKSSASSEMEFACRSPQSVSDQPDEAVQDLWSEEQIDQENKNYESRGSEMSFDCSSSFHSLTGQSKMTAKEINLSKEVHATLQPKSNKSYVSEVSSDCDGLLHLATNRTQVIVKGVSVQKAVPVRLVDECYDSSDSEMNFDCDTSLQSTDDYPQQKKPTKEVDLPNGAHIDLVDKNYGSSDSEISTDSVFPLQSVDQPPVAVTETELQKNVHIGLVDMNYGSSCSETSFDSDVSLQSVVVHPQRAGKESVVVYPQLAGKERNLKNRHVYLKDETHRSSSARAHLDCELSIEAVTHEPQRAVEEVNLLKEKNDLVHMNCEYYGSEMSFHTDAQLVADQPQVAVQELKPQEVATDLQNKSANSSVSDLSFDSHASLYQSSKEPLGTLSDINLKELSVDMEVRSNGCSSSELTFDSDPTVLSVTKNSELDVEEIRKKHINLEDESYGSNSSEITFDSDIPHCSVVDQSRAAIYGEEPTGLRYKGNESCVSEIASDSNKHLHSGTDHPGVVREIIIQKENYVNLGRANNEPIASKMNLDSYVPPHSVTNPPEVAVKGLNLEKEEQVYCESKENEPTGSELSLNYNIFHSVIGHSADLLKEKNLQKEEHVHLENEGSGSHVSEMNLKSYASHLVTDRPDIAVKEINHQKEHTNVEHKGNDLSVSERGLNFRIPYQSVIQKTAAAVKEMWLQKERQLKFKDKSVKCSGSEITLGSDRSHSVTEPQIVVKERNVQKEKHVLENSNTSSGSEINLNSHVLPQPMTGKPQMAVLKEDHVDPEDESTESRGFEINFHTNTPRPSVIDQSHLALSKEKHVDLEGTNRESSVYKVRFASNDLLQPLTEQFQEVVKQTNMWKVEDIGLENKVEPNSSKLIQDSDVSLRSLPDQPEAAAKQVNLDNEGHVYFEDNNSRYSSSEMSLDSDYLAQSVVDQSQVTILEKQQRIELEDKHNQTCGSEISFDSDDPLQSVADQLRETVKEISLWKDEDVEDRGDKSQRFEIMYDSNVPFQSVAGQTEEVIKEINLWKKHVDLEGKIVKLSDSKINFVSDGPLQPVTNEIQEGTTEINLVSEGHICMDDKGYEPNESEVIYISDVPLQSVVEHAHVLEDDHVNLGDKSNDPCGPEVSFASDGPLPSVADDLQKAVKVVSPWKEDRIYLGDKSYKLGDFEVSYDSDVPLVADQSPLVVKQTDLQKKDHNDLENKNCEPSVSEIKCDSGIHLQLEVDQPQMVCKEINLQRIAHLGMEEKTSDSEVMSDSDVPLQIVVNEFQVSVKEANLPKMLLVDLVTSDSDCEMISDSGIPFQPVIDSPQMTVEGIGCINAKSFDLEGEGYDCCDSELGYVCEASQSVSNQSKKTFKVINQKKDYIILEESGCESYGSEINFQIDASDQSLACQSPGSDKKVISYIDPEDKSCEPNSPKRNFKWEDTSQPVTHHSEEVNFWKDPGTTGPKDNCECSVSAVDCNASPESAILQMADEDNLLKLKCTESMSCEPCGSGNDFQCDPSFQSNTDQPQQAINQVDLVKKISVDVKGKKHDSHSNSVPKGDPIKNRKKAKGVKEDKTDEPVLEALPHVPPSFVGKTWSQIMKEDDMKINALVKEFKEGRFHCYFDDDCETRKVKKKNLNEEKKITSADLNDTTLIQVLLDCDDIIDDFSVALDKPSHHPTEKRPYEQTWRVASRCQAVKVSHGTQTNLMSYLVTKGINGQEEDSPTRKRLLLHNDRKPKKIKIGTVEFLESCTNILKPLHPNALVYVLSSNIKLKEGDSFNFSKTRHCSDKNQDFSIQCKYKQSSFNYDPLSKQIVINPPLNIEVPESDRNNWVQIHFSDLNSSAGDDIAHVQSSTTIPFMTLSVRHELMSHQGPSGPCVFLEKAEILDSSDDTQEGKFQLTLLNDDVKISPKSVRNKSLESKKKIRRRKVTNNKPGFLKKVRPIILQQKTRITSGKQSIWIQTKLNDIIRKYLSKYSMFLRRRYQSRNAFSSMHRKKKKPDVSRLKEVQRPAKTLSNSVPSAGGEEHLRAIASSSPERPVQNSSSKARNKKSANKKKPRKKKRRPKPVKIYDLRSLYSQVPYSDRMMTRLLHKLLLSKAH